MSRKRLAGATLSLENPRLQDLRTEKRFLQTTGANRPHALDQGRIGRIGRIGFDLFPQRENVLIECAGVEVGVAGNGLADNLAGNGGHPHRHRPRRSNCSRQAPVLSGGSAGLRVVRSDDERHFMRPFPQQGNPARSVGLVPFPTDLDDSARLPVHFDG